MKEGPDAKSRSTIDVIMGSIINREWHIVSIDSMKSIAVIADLTDYINCYFETVEVLIMTINLQLRVQSISYKYFLNSSLLSFVCISFFYSFKLRKRRGKRWTTILIIIEKKKKEKHNRGYERTFKKRNLKDLCVLFLITFDIL